MATAAAISRAGRRGVLIKGGIHLEELNRVRVVAFDKTGTLTRGRPQVTDLVPADGVAEAELLSLAAAVEAADVALMGDDPRGVVTALEVARGAQRIARQNMVFSILLLLVLVPSAILGLLGVAVTVLLHEVSELLAVANGLRAARV